MQQTDYERRGYLHEDFRLFHLSSALAEDTAFHYHEFHKLVFFLAGRGNYIVEGRTHVLRPLRSWTPASVCRPMGRALSCGRRQGGAQRCCARSMRSRRRSGARPTGTTCSRGRRCCSCWSCWAAGWMTTA